MGMVRMMRWMTCRPPAVNDELYVIGAEPSTGRLDPGGQSLMLSWREREADMTGETAGGAGVSWLIFSLMTVVTWGLYGVFLHLGQTSMQDPVNGRYRAVLFVGIAYFLTAVLAPFTLLLLKGASWQFPVRGMA